MRRVPRSNQRFRSTWLVLRGAIAFSVASTGYGDVVTTGNLIINPGFETGILAPTIDANSPQGTVVSGPASMPAGSIQATEGQHWYKLPYAAYSVYPSGTTAYGLMQIEQTVDVRDFESIDSVTVGGDVFGVGQVWRSGHWVGMRATPIACFLDAGGQTLSFDIGDSHSTSLFSPRIMNDIRFTLTDIPAGTAYVRYVFDVDMLVSGDGDTLGYAEAILGVDDLFLSVTGTPIPEPATLLCCIAAFIWLARRARRR